MTSAINRTESLEGQYSLAKILAIWAVVSLPMAVLAWVVAPALSPYVPLHPAIVYWLLIIVGLIWQFVVSLIILRRELGSLRWELVRKRIWLNLPKGPTTGKANAKLFWWLVPCLLFSAVASLLIAPYIDAPVAWLLSSLGVPAQPDVSQLVDPQFKGQWWLLAVAIVSAIFNYFLGEELLFRGVLLPKMKGVFGKWDWLANALLFGFYHLHKPWTLPSIILGSLATTWPARRFQSNWLAVIVHGVEAYFIVFVLAVILGYAP